MGKTVSNLHANKIPNKITKYPKSNEDEDEDEKIPKLSKEVKFCQIQLWDSAPGGNGLAPQVILLHEQSNT